MMNQIAVLFARRDSIYKTYEQCDVYDIDRDAKTFKSSFPVIAHPPCRAWGRLRSFSKHRDGEKELALWAVDIVRKNGGVLEHPESSSLWNAKSLPLGAETDDFGGWTLSVDQHWFGHLARKKTWIYICGISRKQLPDYSIRFEPITHVLCGSKYRGAYSRPEVSKDLREHTPVDFAKFLIDIAKNYKLPTDH